jgi:hypothetical protein
LLSSQQSVVLSRYLSCLGYRIEDLGLRLAAMERDFYFLQNIRVASGAHTDSHLMGIWSFVQGQKAIGGVALTANPHLVQSLRMNGGKPQFHQNMPSFIDHSTPNSLYSC